jgi:hypothetical protein
MVGSCVQNSEKSKVLNSTSRVEKQKNEPENNLLNYVQTIKGTWVNKAYFESIQKNKSPFKTQNENPYYMVYIKPEMIKNQMIGIYDFEYGQTEISNIPYYTWKYNALAFQFNTFDGKTTKEKGYKYFTKISLIIEKGDTILHVERSDHLSFDLKRIATKCFDNSFDCEITQFVTTTILEGNYTFRDSNKVLISNNLKIDHFGSISGNKKFKRAILWNFFRESNAVVNHDIIELIPAKSDISYYGIFNENVENLFKFENKKDTIILRKLSYDKEQQQVSSGRVGYYLVRK